MRMPRAAIVVLSCLLSTGCAATVPGSATWPGATLAAVALGAADFPPGVTYDRIIEQPGQPDGAGAPGPMPSRPQGCSNALTDVIAEFAERGPGSAVKYSAGYDGARIVMTVLSWNLDLDRLRAEADRCAQYETFFSPDSEGIPVVTTDLAGLGPEALAYRQTMTLGRSQSSVYMAFQNAGSRAAFAIAYPADDPDVPAKATLPQTFLDIFAEQIGRLRSS